MTPKPQKIEGGKKCPNCKKGVVSWVDFSNVFSCSHCFYTRTKPQKIEGGWEEQRSKLLEDFFVEVEPNNKAGEFIVDGQWYAPKFGCDTLEMVVDEVEYLLASERQRCVEDVEKINRIVGNIYKINKDDHNRLDKDLLYLAGETSNLLKKLDQAKYNLEQIK